MCKKILLSILLFTIIFFLPTEAVFSSDKNMSTESNKVIYLTFDDGPSTNTDKILDILKEENVPGTFFLMGKLIEGKEDIVKRIYCEGSSIGLHSFSHERSIYSSKDIFLNDMLKTQNLIENIIGTKVYIIRFPFGTNNSKFKLKESWVNLLHDNSLKIYDWTQDTEDGLNINSSPDIIFKKAVSKKDKIVLLMHCAEANKNSVKALPQIIKYYKSQGYTFEKITPETPEIYKILK